MKIVNGIEVRKARVYKEGGYHRWQITTVDGREYVDGGNYLTREQAEAGLRNAYDPTNISQFACLRCGHVWWPRSTVTPVRCPKCRSPYWGRPRRITK